MADCCTIGFRLAVNVNQLHQCCVRSADTPCQSDQDLYVEMMSDNSFYHTVIIGAGAAGLMCAAHAGAQGGRVLVVEHNKSPGEKIRISGGGRCNFTNMHTTPDNFISGNPHFAKSALKRYTQWDFIELVKSHQIAWHEKTLGQLFCDGSAKQIISMLLAEMEKVGAELRLETSVSNVSHDNGQYELELSAGEREYISCQNLVIASGGKSILKMGATGFGYQVARQFDLDLTPTRAGLVPLVFAEEQKDAFKEMAGVSCAASLRSNGAQFEEALLFTHRGLSGSSVLQVSSYWQEKEPVQIMLLPGEDIFSRLRAARAENGRRDIVTVLADLLPKRLSTYMGWQTGVSGNIADFSDKRLRALSDLLANWEVWPIGTEGYRTAEVTLGGVSTDDLNSRTMEAISVPGLYFIGEVVDVTGWLGGYNFQWAWSSGWAAGQAIAQSNLR